MSKESRRRQRTASQSPNPDSSSSDPPSSRPTAGAGDVAGTPRASSPRPSTSPTGSVRVGRRERPRSSTAKASFLERSRTLFIGVAVAAIVAVVGAGLFSAATQPVYACSNIWEPDPSPTPAEGSPPRPGYAQPDMGEGHPALGTHVTYTYCPPASGKHFQGSATGPISARVYGPDDAVNPQGWIHNLEHGGLVVLYRGDSEGATEAGQAQLREFFGRYPPSPVCGFKAGTSVGPVFARFDDMATPFAALVWGRVLPLQSIDEAAILQLDSIYGERTSPEDLCPDMRVSPSPSGSAAPSTSTAPSPSPAPSGSAAPSPSGSAASPSAS